MHLQFGIPTFRKTSKPLNKSNAEQHVTFLMTTQPEHQGALQAWSTESSGKALRQEEEMTDSLCCIGSSMDWSIYIQTATYNRVTDEQEGSIVSTKKEFGVRPTIVPSSQEQSGTGTCYHPGQHQRRHWRDSGQTLLFATQCPATRLPVVDVHSFNGF